MRLWSMRRRTLLEGGERGEKGESVGCESVDKVAGEYYLTGYALLAIISGRCQ